MPIIHEVDVGATLAGVSFSATGDQEIVAAVSGKKIRVHALWIACTTNTSTILTPKSGSTAFGPVFRVALISNVLPWSNHGYYVTTAGEAFNLGSSSSSPTVKVGCWYTLE